LTLHAIRNLKTLEDQAAKFGFGPALEARFARTELGCERTGLSYQRLAPGARAPFSHRHANDEEIYVVVGGSGQMLLGEELLEVGVWDAIRVSPNVARAFAAGPDGLELLAFGEHTDDDAAQLPPNWPG
jgi:uncharacterized cupin superfamily protein